MAGDSILWEKAYAAYKREIQDFKRWSRKKTKQKKLTPKEIKKRNRALIQKYKNKKIMPKPARPLWLYALELEDGCYYIGMSTNVERRFKYHLKGEGAIWTRMNKPIKILEKRPTNTVSQNTAAVLEDAMTVEYAAKYGTDRVRGGGYCQRKPRWPVINITLK